MSDNGAIKQRLGDEMKAAMRAKDAARLGVIRLIMAAIKQREVDERITLDDTQVIEVLGRMVKQRRESISQFEAAARQDLVDKENAELGVIQEFLPAALAETEVKAILEQVLAETGASSARDMGKVMAALRPRLQGRADMGQVSALVKARLSGA